ncbi:hypothetical protein MNBD_GAMMA22-870 [hydrothermal vent metagenome]|uniref:Serine aminopeptidase S33 domain-containing protein n=1 Tax=hydrothermal vent metagenome TaxID=652676 RepID=A0A3B1A8L4_9ZZZZ
MISKIHLLLLLFSFLLSSCTGFIFQPTDIQYIDPEKNHIQYQDVYFKTENNIKLHGWFLPSRETKPKGTILFLHGNAQNITAHINSVFWLPYFGFNVFLFDYQGYGQSEGAPSLSGVQQDFHHALQWLVDNPTIDKNKIIVFGQSLGATISLYALSQSKYKDSIRGMVADSGFTSYRNIAQDFLNNSWLTWAFQWPLSYTISDDYPAINAIPQISPVPLLIIHSLDDRVIPYHHGVTLFKAAKEPKYFWTLKKIKHINIFSVKQNRIIFVEYLNAMLSNQFPIENN